MKFINTLVLVVLVVVAVAFAMTNAESVKVYYYVGEATMPLSLALGLAVVIGSFLGVLACLKTILCSKYELSKLRKEIKTANKEIANLRSIPIKDEH